MKITLLCATAMALFASAALAAPVDDLVKSLTDQGATHLEVSQRATTTKVEGVLNGQRVEVTIDTATGDVIKQEVAGVEEADNQTGDSADDNGNDAPDSGDDNGGTGEGGGHDGGHDGEHDGSGHDGGDHEGGDSNG